MKDILLVKAISRYDSVSRYVDEWASAMRQLGCNTCILDGWSLAQPALYNHIITKYKFDAVIDCNGILFDWELLKICLRKSYTLHIFAILR